MSSLKKIYYVVDNDSSTYVDIVMEEITKLAIIPACTTEDMLLFIHPSISLNGDESRNCVFINEIFFTRPDCLCLPKNWKLTLQTLTLTGNIPSNQTVSSISKSAIFFGRNL